MTSKRLVEWKCDRCGKTELVADGKIGAPGWLGLLVNFQAADAAYEHQDWRRWHWCPSCADEFSELAAQP